MSGGADRLPLEYARCLDAIFASVPAGAPVYVDCGPRALLQAVLFRHDSVISRRAVGDRPLVPPGTRFEAGVGPGELPTGLDRVVVVCPDDAGTLESAARRFGDIAHDCVLNNPVSYARIAGESLGPRCAPWRARRAYANRGFRTDLTGYHGPASLAQSVRGKLWQILGRMDRRDRYTRRMRAALETDRRPMAYASDVVRLHAEPKP